MGHKRAAPGLVAAQGAASASLEHKKSRFRPCWSTKRAAFGATFVSRCDFCRNPAFFTPRDAKCPERDGLRRLEPSRAREDGLRRLEPDIPRRAPATAPAPEAAYGAGASGASAARCAPSSSRGTDANCPASEQPATLTRKVRSTASSTSPHGNHGL